MDRSVYSIVDGQEYKRCPNCKEVKLLSEYNKLNDGVQAYCRVCSKAIKKDYYHNANGRTDQLRAMYGITKEDVVSVLKFQDNKCAICKVPLSFESKDVNYRPCVDHNHVTNKLRGVLCKRCNGGLGQFTDSIEKLNNAITYLEIHSI